MDRRSGIGTGARQGLGDRAMAFDERDRPFEVARPLIQILDCAMPERALIAIAAREGDQDRQSDFAITEIVTDALAELALPRRKVEHVIDQLEGDPKVTAVTIERL